MPERSIDRVRLFAADQRARASAAELGNLLATGIEQSPQLRVPVVARLVGRGAAEARRILAERQPGMLVTEDLEEALRALPAVRT